MPDWRLLVCGFILTMALLPTLWLVLSTFDPNSLVSVLKGPFVGALKRTFILFGSVIAGSLALGWPAGTLHGLIPFRGQRFFLAALALPLCTPASLWAIGLSSARPFVAYRHQWWFDGFCGALLTGLIQGLPLVLLASCLVARTVPGSQIDSALLVGGWRSLLRASARFSLPAALAAAVFGGLLAIADPGPAQIMGYHGIASQILIALAARYDAGLAARKALLEAFLLLPVVLPIAWLIANWSETHFLGRDTRRASPKIAGYLPWAIFLVCMPPILLLLAAPVAGFVRPLRSAQVSQSFQYAWSLLSQSAATTVRYSFIAAALASILGVVLTLAAGRKHQGRFLLLLFCFVFLSLPAALHVLGFAGIASRLPDWFDFFARGGNAPGLAFGLRWLPIPLLFCIQAWSLVPESACQSATLHGVPAIHYHWKVTLPHILPALTCSLLLVALATAADVSSTLVLLPPGAGTFATRIFGIIDSTTERTLSALCLVYIGAGLAALSLFSFLQAFNRRS